MITDRTRKILWARSGNLCAYCRAELVVDGTSRGAECVVGDEAHIIADKPLGPRGAFGIGRTDLDGYGNLILLCKIHHKLVDDQFEVFSVERLLEMKTKHEQWVRERLVTNSIKEQQKLLILNHITNCSKLAKMIETCFLFVLDHDDHDTREEAGLVGEFLQDIRDYGDIWSDLDTNQQVEIRFTLTQRIQEIEAAGLMVFGTTARYGRRSAGRSVEWPLAIVSVVHPGNPALTNLGQLVCILNSG